MKTCKELGWKEGDKFVVLYNCMYRKGTIVTLVFDDGTGVPRWASEDEHGNGHGSWLSTHIFKPLVVEVTKYTRNIRGVNLDVYDLLDAWRVGCPATQHAIKKLLMPGQRGSKDKLQDLKEAAEAIQRAIELEEGSGGL